MIALTSVQKQLHYAAETNFIAVKTDTSIKNTYYSIASEKKPKCNSTKVEKTLCFSAIMIAAFSGSSPELSAIQHSDFTQASA